MIRSQAIKGIPREKIQVATKFALDPETWTIKGDPEYIRKAVAGSLKRLDVDYIDLYYQHRVDPKIPIEISVSCFFYHKKEEGKEKVVSCHILSQQLPI